MATPPLITHSQTSTVLQRAYDVWPALRSRCVDGARVPRVPSPASTSSSSPPALFENAETAGAGVDGATRLLDGAISGKLKKLGIIRVCSYSRGVILFQEATLSVEVAT